MKLSCNYNIHQECRATKCYIDRLHFSAEHTQIYVLEGTIGVKTHVLTPHTFSSDVSVQYTGRRNFDIHAYCIDTSCTLRKSKLEECGKKVVCI